MTSATAFNNRVAVETFLQAWNDHDVDALLAHLTDDVVWIDPTSPEPIIGKAAVADLLHALFRAFPDIHWPIEDREFYLADSGRAAASWTLVATMMGPLDPPGFPATDRSVRASGVCLYEFREGLICRHTIVYDSLRFLQEVGLLPGDRNLGLRALVGLKVASGRIGHLVKH